MTKKLGITFGLLLLLLMLGLNVIAAGVDDEGTPNDPRTNPRANACYEDGSMENKCHVDFNKDGIVDHYEISWAWTCGWYIIRYEYGMISESTVPATCEVLLAPVGDEVVEEERVCSAFFQGSTIILNYFLIPNNLADEEVFEVNDIFDDDACTEPSTGGSIDLYVPITAFYYTGGDAGAETYSEAVCDAGATFFRSDTDNFYFCLMLG